MTTVITILAPLILHISVFIHNIVSLILLVRNCNFLLNHFQMKNIRLLISSAICMMGFLSGAYAQVPIIHTIAGTSGGGGFAGDGGPATAGRMNTNYMVSLDASGNIYIADNGNNRVRMIDVSTGIISTVAGSASSGSGGDGGAATAAQLGASFGPNPGVVGVTVDGAGNYYIGDGSNNKVRRVDGSTGIITTVAGTGTSGSTGDGGQATAALLSGPRGVVVNNAGTLLYIADANNNRIRVVDLTTGIINNFAGAGGGGTFSGDGAAATLARLNSPRGVFLDPAGNLYITDMSNQRVRKVDIGTGIITTVAGSSSTAGFAGDGGAATAARLSGPTDMKMDALGNMFIADVGNNRIRYVDLTGTISTIVGTSGGGAFAGDWGPATAARLNGPASVAILAPNWYYISDRSNNRIRLVRPNSIPYFTNGTALSLTVCENSSANSIDALLSITDSDQVQTETWSVVTPPANGTLVVTATGAANGGVLIPSGLTFTPNVGFSGTDAFTIQISDGYNTATTTVSVTVNPLPVVAAITGLDNVCEASTITLSDATGGGVWSASNANASVVGGTVTGVTAGTVDISYTVTNACGPTSVTHAVTVNPLPVSGTITGTAFVCTGLTTTLSDVAPSGTWSASNTNASVVGGTVTGVTTGLVDISYTVVNGCGSSSAVQTVTVDAIPLVAPIAGSNTVCEAATTTLTDATGGGVWSASNANATVAGGVVTGVTAGTVDISYTVTNGCGTTPVSLAMTVNPLPVAGTLTGAPNLCIGDNTTLSGALPGGVWTTSNSNASVSAGVVTGVSAGSCVISYSVTNSCGTAVATFTINIISSPSAGVITGPTNVCPGAAIALTDGVGGGVWDVSNANATITGGGVLTGVTAGIDTVSYTVIVSCGSATATYVVTVDPLPDPGVIAGASSVCVGSGITLTDASTGGTWSSSSTSVATISSGGLVTGITGGLTIITYSVTNVCGTAFALKNVTVNPNVTPAVTFTAAPGFTTCPGTLVTYTGVPVNGGPSPVYSWRVNGFTLGAGAAFNHTPVNGDVIAVTMTSSAGCVIPTTASDSVTVVVNPTLVPSANITTGVVGDTVCVGTITTYTATAVNGGTTPSYVWYVNGSAMASGNPFTYIPAHGDVIYASLTSSYPCPSSASVPSNSITMTVDVTETPAVTITVSPGSPVCTGTAVTYSAHPLYGGVPPFFRWTKNGVNVATGPVYVMVPANGDNVFCLMASAASCRTVDTVLSNHIIMTTQNPVPVSVSITQSSSVIGIGQLDIFTATVVSAALTPTYQWYVNGVLVPGATNSTYIIAGTTPGTETVHCVAGSGDACFTTGTSNTLTVTTANVGVNNISGTDNGLKLSPNPNKGAFTINISSAVDEPVHVVVTNVLGAVVKEFDAVTNSDVAVSLQQAAGIYMLSASTGHSKYVAKVIVE